MTVTYLMVCMFTMYMICQDDSSLQELLGIRVISCVCELNHPVQ